MPVFIIMPQNQKKEEEKKNVPYWLNKFNLIYNWVIYLSAMSSLLLIDRENRRQAETGNNVD